MNVGIEKKSTPADKIRHGHGAYTLMDTDVGLMVSTPTDIHTRY